MEYEQSKIIRFIDSKWSAITMVVIIVMVFIFLGWQTLTVIWEANEYNQARTYTQWTVECEGLDEMGQVYNLNHWNGGYWTAQLMDGSQVSGSGNCLFFQIGE